MPRPLLWSILEVHLVKGRGRNLESGRRRNSAVLPVNQRFSQSHRYLWSWGSLPCCLTLERGGWTFRLHVEGEKILNKAIFFSWRHSPERQLKIVLQAAFPIAEGVRVSFLKGDQPTMATAMVEFPKRLCSREWCITEVGAGTRKSIQMLPGLKWYFSFSYPEALGNIPDEEAPTTLPSVQVLRASLPRK